ncbi:hypothetical protein JTE90_004531 [Oedothorax gibbosus]|uniref:C2 domain-containing protein 5 n=1 Tax=Oedothorax gibbosus TaxID=931172 RepID=A0AAV6VE11_9ARAC|nr:hypothetical protein JTE90_004531 [Oedothorax gibbosus]
MRLGGRKEDADHQLDPDQMNLSLNGCGYLGIYHVGVCSCIKKYYPNALKGAISGGSVGALVACAFMCDVPLDICAKYVFDVSMIVRNGILGPMSPDLNIMKVLRDSMDAMLPEDAHLHCDGRLHVSATRFDNGKNVLLTKFATRDELLQALMCSCFIPVYCGYEPPVYYGVAYVDAALSNNSPWLNKHTVAVAPFSGNSDICPENDGLFLKSLTLSNTSIGLTAKNMKMLFRVLFPASPDIQKDICQQGYNDALRFLRDKGLLNCEDCVAKDTNSGHAGCKSPEDEIPFEITNEIQKAILEFQKDLGYRLFQYRSMKVLYYLNMPSIVSAKIAYIIISTILQKVQSKASLCVDGIWGHFFNALKDGLYGPRKRSSLRDSDATSSTASSCYVSDAASDISDDAFSSSNMTDEATSDLDLSSTDEAPTTNDDPLSSQHSPKSYSFPQTLNEDSPLKAKKMPGKVKIRIVAGRNLPVMDRSSDTCDAFVEIKLANTTYKTEVFRHSLNPEWNSEWFRFEVDDEELQDEPLQIRVMDYDTYSANDAIGKIYIDLNPLLCKESGSLLSGWFPIYDTMHGIRGEINVMVRVHLFSDSNKYRESSCGVQFFYSGSIPYGFKAKAILGFVEELVVNDDPEYQWIDKIRTPRATNEARQTLFNKLSGEVQRKIGLKALELGGNAVIGYHQCFDLEGESGIVVRGIGTAVVLAEKIHSSQNEAFREQSPTRVALRRVASNTSVATTEPRNSSLFPLFGSSRSRSPSPIKVGLTSGFFKSATRSRNPSVSPKRMAKARSELFSPVYEDSKERATGSHLKRFSSFKANASQQNVGPDDCVLCKSDADAPKKKVKSPSANLKSLSLLKSGRANASQQSELHGSCTSNTSKDITLQSVSKPCTSLQTSQPNVSYANPEYCTSLQTTTTSQPNVSNTESFKDSKRWASAQNTGKDSEASSEKAAPRHSKHPSKHSNGSQLKRICSDPLCPRSPLPEDQIVGSAPGPNSPTEKVCHSPAKGAISAAHRRSSDSDLSSTPKGNSFGDNSVVLRSISRPAVAQESLSMLEYPFITMRQFPPGFIQHIGGVVSARSVKLLVQINNPDEPETRDAWWTELRKEIRSHIRALGCNVVLGYMETTNISDDICVLSASGTAAVLSTSDQDTNPNTPPVLATNLQPRPVMTTSSSSDHDKPHEEVARDRSKRLKIDVNLANQVKTHPPLEWSEESRHLGCRICHIPYSESSVPFPTNLVRCGVCRRGKVPDILFMTIEPPPNIQVNGKSCLLQARVCKSKKDSKGEQNAKEISDSLPFLEYELHRQLLNKLKVKCMNAIFSLKVQVTIGDKLIIGIATGTGAYLSALPPPNLPKLACGKVADPKKMAQVQKQIQDAMNKNKEFFNIKLPCYDNTSAMSSKGEDANSSGDEDMPDLDLSAGNKDACILEVDDADDVDIIAQLIDPKVPPGFDLCNTETLPGLDCFACNLQMFTRIFRRKFSTPPNSTQVSKTFESVIKSLFVKLRRLTPCCLTNLSFQVDLVEQDELQVTVLGIAIGLGEMNLSTYASAAGSSGSRNKKTSADSEMIFHMDDDKTSMQSSTSAPAQHRRVSLQSSTGDRSYCYHLTFGEHNGVDITPLSYIPGKKILQYLGNLDFFFIRESNSIRESGGLNGFIQSFVAETLAIVRAHVSALGGNAMVGFHMTQCILLHNPHKNQGQCLVNVAGDAVLVQNSGVLQSMEVDDMNAKVAHFEVQDSYGP